MRIPTATRNKDTPPVSDSLFKAGSHLAASIITQNFSNSEA